MTEEKQDHHLILYLLGLQQKQDRAALSALRSGIGKTPGESTRMFPFIVRFLKEGGSDPAQLQSVFLTASLFASHPSHARVGNLGASLRHAVRAKHGEDGVSARFTAALDADPEDLPRKLVELVGLCESAGAPLDWNRFYWDACHLLGQDDDSRNRTRLAWARGFWSPSQDDAQAANTQENKP